MRGRISSSGTTGGHGLTVKDVQRDFGMLIELADESNRPPLLIGVSEGAGLAVVAAADPRIRDQISGVVAVGLTDINELGWRWRDSIIYLTKGVPNEPVFHATDFISQVSPAPLALLWSTHDEFVGDGDQKRLAALARTPKRVLTVRGVRSSILGQPAATRCEPDGRGRVDYSRFELTKFGVNCAIFESQFAWPAPCSEHRLRATGPRGGAWMTKRKRALPARKRRDRSRDDESLLLRSAESLGRVIGVVAATT